MRDDFHHHLQERYGDLDHLSVAVVTAIISMYAKYGDLHKAKEVFINTVKCLYFLIIKQIFANYKPLINPSTNTAPLWITIIQAHSNNGAPHEALQLFHKMISVGIEPEEYTYACILSIIIWSNSICLHFLK